GAAPPPIRAERGARPFRLGCGGFDLSAVGAREVRVRALRAEGPDHEHSQPREDSMSYVRASVTVGGKEISIETGKWAKQAAGSVVIRLGDTMVLVTAGGSKNPREGMDFLPLTCEYQEKFYAAGRIPGSYFRREGRPSESEILVARLMDRPSRPLFPKGWRIDTQLIANVVSFDKENAADVLALTGAAAALHLSDSCW